LKIAVVGAGAIGGLVGVKLALAGEDVTFMVRGANLSAIQAQGMKLVLHDATELVAKNLKISSFWRSKPIKWKPCLAIYPSCLVRTRWW
jgi:2-dehydropantoate 2-reductase